MLLLEVSDLIGADAQRDANDNANQRLNNVVQSYMGIEVPSVEDMELLLEEFQVAGVLTPELEQAVKQGETNFSNIVEDSRLKDAQLNALLKLQEIGNEGGMSIQDKAQYAELEREIDNNTRGRNQAVMQSMAQRGMSGSGMELAALLGNEQSAANNLNQRSMDVNAQAQARALEALMSAGQLGGEIRQQDYNVASDKAQAQDVINQFNTQIASNTNSRNTDRKNQAQEYNLTNSQNVLNQNIDNKNFQQQYNKELQQNYFDNQLKQADGASGLQRDIANQTLQQGQDERQMWGNIGGGIMQAFTGGTQKGSN